MTSGAEPKAPPQILSRKPGIQMKSGRDYKKWGQVKKMEIDGLETGY